MKACVVRYGGIGDMIQASSVLPGLKAQGYHVTMLTTPQGREIVREDPHIDEFFIQQDDEVPNEKLPEFWAQESKRFDKWVNLSESVEMTWLAVEGRRWHEWPHAVRHKYLNRNYLEFIHDLAGVPYDFGQRFYPTVAERGAARTQRSRIPGLVVGWSLAGSAPHKSWPWTDHVIQVLLREGIYVLLMGDKDCQILEADWKGKPGIICTSGRWSVRESLAFLEVADLVIGPETGILNAAGMLPMPKIVMLSHSSEENLTKHWINTIALKSDVACYPCHQMHYNWDHCWQDRDSTAAMCQAQITVAQVLEAMQEHLRVAA